jgi:ABC-type multidrug transport system ATPase subunit
MVRPKKTEHRRGLLIKLLSQEKEIIRQQAHLAGLTVSEYIRKCALNRPIRSRVSRDVAAELSKLFGLQKHLLREIKNLPNEEELRRQLNSVLLELHMALATFNKNTAE